MTNGRDKGRRAELVVAKLLEAWWEKVEPGCRFVRTPSSGGWHGPDVRAEFKTSGDIMVTAKRWPFSVEVKKREKWSLDRVLDYKASPVWDWMRQCATAAAEDGRAPLLILGKNRTPWYAMLHLDQLGLEVMRRVGEPPLMSTSHRWSRIEYMEAVVVVPLAVLLELDPHHFARPA